MKINRREAIKQGGFGVGSLALTGITGSALGISVLPDPACKGLPKNFDLYIDIITSSLSDIAPLLPSAAQLIAKGIKIANDIKDDYKAGKFKDGTALVANLVDVFNQIFSDAGINDPRVKLALAIAKTALHTVALILAAQAGQPAVAAVVANLSPDEIAQLNKVKALTDPAAINKIFAAVK